MKPAALTQMDVSCAMARSSSIIMMVSGMDNISFRELFHDPFQSLLFCRWPGPSPSHVNVDGIICLRWIQLRGEFHSRFSDSLDPVAKIGSQPHQQERSSPRSIENQFGGL